MTWFLVVILVINGEGKVHTYQMPDLATCSREAERAGKHTTAFCAPGKP